MPKDTIEAFTNLLKNLPSRQEFVDSFANVVKRVKDFEASLTRDFSTLVKTLNDKIDARLAEIKDGKDGRDGAPGKDGIGIKGDKGDDGKPGESVIGPAGKDGSPDMAEDIRNKLELLTGDERLKATALSGLDEEIKKLAADFKTGGTTVGWGAHPLTVRGLGINIDKNTRVIDFRGAGLTSVTRSRDGIVTVTVGGGSGTLSPIALTGTINDSNVTFTAASTPTFLVINGSIYQATGGNITWANAALTITLSSPVGQNGSIYGL